MFLGSMSALLVGHARTIQGLDRTVLALHLAQVEVVQEDVQLVAILLPVHVPVLPPTQVEELQVVIPVIILLPVHVPVLPPTQVEVLINILMFILVLGVGVLQEGREKLFLLELMQVLGLAQLLAV
jgi:hypothetical protein